MFDWSRCLVAAATWAAKGAPPILLKQCLRQTELEFDLKGRLELSWERLNLDVGEVKSTADYSSAVPQLGIRLMVLKYIALAALEHFSRNRPASAPASPDVFSTGRLFVPKRAVKVAHAHADSQQISAAGVMGFDLYLHAY